MKEYFKFCLIYFLLTYSSSALAQTDWSESPSSKMSIDEQKISLIWDYRKLAHKTAFENLQLPNTSVVTLNTFQLYKFQSNTNLLFDYLVERYNAIDQLGRYKNRQTLDELIEITEIPFTKLVTKNQFTYYLKYPEGGYQWKTSETPSSIRYWPDKKTISWPIKEVDADGKSIPYDLTFEYVINSAQFLYLNSRMLRRFSEVKNPTLRMTQFNNTVTPVILEHLRRWTTDPTWQVIGWGCKQNGKSVLGYYTVQDYLQGLIDNTLGNNYTHCSVMIDEILWISGIMSEMLIVDKLKDNSVLSASDRSVFNLTVGRTSKLLENRLALRSGKNFRNQTVSTRNIDPGLWASHGDYSHAGYNKSEPTPFLPEPTLNIDPIRGSTELSWDLSHARRFVNIIDSLISSKDITGITFPNSNTIKEMSNQLAYNVFNRNLDMPAFTNYWDGTNGWYRVNYNKRYDGYQPWWGSYAFLTGGYCSWSKYNPDLKTACQAVYNMGIIKNHPAQNFAVNGYYNNGAISPQYVYENIIYNDAKSISWLETKSDGWLNFLASREIGKTKSSVQVGFVRSGVNFLDTNGDKIWDSKDRKFSFTAANSIKFTGDFDGDGYSEIGLFVNGTWYIDYNSNEIWEGNALGKDKTFYYGTTGDIPVVGDWNGDGKDNIGIFRNGLWYLDLNGNNVLDATGESLQFGAVGDKPIIGNWNDDAKDEIGVFRKGVWYLDSNSNRRYGSGDARFSFGNFDDVPIIGDWDGDGKDNIGVFRNAKWYQDINNDYIWNSPDISFNFGLSGDQPIIGSWKPN